MQIATPYLMFLGDVPDTLAAKTAYGIVDWRPEWCVGQMRLPGCAADLGIPDLTLAEALAKGCRTMVIGVVNAGGVLPEHWVAEIVAALEAGLDVASGLHVRLGAVPAIAEAAARRGRQLHDVRHTDRDASPPARAPSGRAGACSPSAPIARSARSTPRWRWSATCARAASTRISAPPARPASSSPAGASPSTRWWPTSSPAPSRWISPAADPNHWDLIEGQGSLFHPSFAGVSLGLLHGAQPDAFVVCHEPTRTTMRGVPHPLPTIQQVIDLTVQLGSLTNPAIRPVGIAVNTQALGEAEARALLATLGGRARPARHRSGALRRRRASSTGSSPSSPPGARA